MRQAAGPRTAAREDPPPAALNTASRLPEACLCVITPDREPDEIRALVQAVLRGGAQMIQLRHKTLSRRGLYELAGILREMCHAHDVPLVVNDHLDIAMAVGADGVHLGADDLSIDHARRVAGPALLIGATASDFESAARAIAGGADYLGTGPAFTTAVKPEKAILGPSGVAAIARAVGSPVFAIGGITLSNVSQVVAAGIRRVCVIGDVAQARDPEDRVRALVAALTR